MPTNATSWLSAERKTLATSTAARASGRERELWPYTAPCGFIWVYRNCAQIDGWKGGGIVYVVQEAGRGASKPAEGADLVYEARLEFILSNSRARSENVGENECPQTYRFDGHFPPSKPWRSGRDGCAPTRDAILLRQEHGLVMIEKSLRICVFIINIP